MVAGAAVLLAMATASSASPLVVGQPFPSLELPSLRDGRRASVKDYRGNKLMLHVWASW